MDGRTGQGLLITTGTFTKAAREEADRGGGAKPIDLVNGENLMSLMREHRLGLVLDDEQDTVLGIDHDYFRRLAR
jgi:restriction system protein